MAVIFHDVPLKCVCTPGPQREPGTGSDRRPSQLVLQPTPDKTGTASEAGRQTSFRVTASANRASQHIVTAAGECAVPSVMYCAAITAAAAPPATQTLGHCCSKPDSNKQKRQYQQSPRHTSRQSTSRNSRKRVVFTAPHARPGTVRVAASEGSHSSRHTSWYRSSGTSSRKRVVLSTTHAYVTVSSSKRRVVLTAKRPRYSNSNRLTQNTTLVQ